MGALAAPPVTTATGPVKTWTARTLGTLLSAFGLWFAIMLIGGFSEAQTHGHAIHEVATIGQLVGMLSIPLLLLVWRGERAAAFKPVVLVMAGLSIVLPLLVGLFDPFSLVIAILMLFSAWLVPVPWWPKTFPSRSLLVLAGFGALAYARYGWNNATFQLNAVDGDQHAEFQHYLGQVFYILGVSAMVGLAAARQAGSRLLGWMGGLLVVAMGAAFIIFDAVGDLPVWAGAVTVLGGLTTIALVERARAATI